MYLCTLPVTYKARHLPGPSEQLIKDKPRTKVGSAYYKMQLSFTGCSIGSVIIKKRKEVLC